MGCIPTKAMLHSAQLYREASQFELFGLHTENTSFDWEKIHQRKNEVVTKLRGGIEQLIKANKIDFFNKSASILGKNDVQLGQGEEILHAENILIATGSVPARPPIPGLDLPGVVTSDELLDDPRTEVAELPREEELDEPLTEPEEALPLDADEPERTLLLDDEPRDADDEYRDAFGL